MFSHCRPCCIAWWNGTSLPAGFLAVAPDEQAKKSDGGGKVASKLQTAAKQRLAGRKEQFSDLLQGQLLCRVAMPLAVVWFAAAFVYYGQILIQTNMFAAEEAGERCPEYDVGDPQEPDDPDVCAELVSMVNNQTATTYSSLCCSLWLAICTLWLALSVSAQDG